jgi:hypothetical protein
MKNQAGFTLIEMLTTTRYRKEGEKNERKKENTYSR